MQHTLLCEKDIPGRAGELAAEGMPKKAFTALNSETLGELWPCPAGLLVTPACWLSELCRLEDESPEPSLAVAEVAAEVAPVADTEAAADAEGDGDVDVDGDVDEEADSTTRQGARPSRLSTVSFCGV